MNRQPEFTGLKFWLMLFVVFTMRGTLIRVISARDQSRREREVYGHAQEAELEDPPV